MRLLLALSFVATTLSATTFFDPPNPTSATQVVAHVYVSAAGCLPDPPVVARTGATIAIALPPCSASQPGAPEFHFAVSLGVLPAGVYDVRVNDIERTVLVVRDAVPPFEVIPDVVPTTGGTVHIRSSALDFSADFPVIKIGGERVFVFTGRDQHDVGVFLWKNAPGAADVSIDNVATATAALDFFEEDKTPEPAFFEPVLFPALVDGGGAYGSHWSTDVVLRNDNDFRLPVVSPFLNIACDNRPSAHESVILRNADAPNGSLFYVPRQFAPRLFFDVVGHDLSRQRESLGTEIPVARENDFYDRPFSIALVPIDPKYRTALRIFRIDGGTTAHLTIFAMADDFLGSAPPVQADVALAVGAPNTPMFTSVTIPDLASRFPALAGKGRVRIVVDGGTVRRATWALVSVTNNETQQVTVLAPH